jgi:L-rhamnose mutarotase
MGKYLNRWFIDRWNTLLIVKQNNRSGYFYMACKPNGLKWHSMTEDIPSDSLFKRWATEIDKVFYGTE